MAKRAAEDNEHSTPGALKDGDRPEADGGVAVGEDFEDEFEDEFESEDEILEAGVDGRPDEEREAEERASGNTRRSAKAFVHEHITDTVQVLWKLTKRHSYRDETN